MRLTLFAGLKPLGARAALREILPGITLASMDIPQVLGYTRIAGMPVVTGLYTALLPTVAFAVFGSSPQLVVAADSATAAIFSGALTPMAAPGGPRYLALAGIVALLTALLLLLARIFRLGFLADFLSRTVLTGFLTGVGAQVGIAMLPDMLGLGAHARHSLPLLLAVLQGLPQANPAVTVLSLLVTAAILAGHTLTPRLPVPLLAVVGGIGASALLHFAAHGIAVIGPVPGGLPGLGLPAVDAADIPVLLPVAGSCLVMILAQSAATARVYAVRHHQRVDADADLLGLSAANAAAALSGAFVVNGSPTQTAMGESAGARTQAAHLVLAAVVLAVLLAFTGPLRYLPRCVLAGVVFTIAARMIDLRTLAAIRRESPGEFALALFTAAAVVGIGVEQGILMAIVLSLLRHVRHSYRPHTAVLAAGPAGRWVDGPAQPGAQTEPGLIVYRFGADLFYANDGHFADEVRALVQHAPVPVRRFVVDAAAVTAVDYSAARTVRDLITELKARGVTVIFGRASPYLQSDMQRHGITPVLGPGCLFATLHEALAAQAGAQPAVPAGTGGP
ncbi:MAG TPA: SulP family inorganic anion transporter [Steroidobacteraceae bacterium]|nr:SulP family inorganic anion transporter [Steroidobacteraceae bacterium]